MKYNSKNRPLVCMQTTSTCYKGTYKMGEIRGILWHSTGANNPTLKRYVQPSDNAADRAEMLKLLGTNTNKNDWNHIVRYAGMNAWIGKLADGTVATVQTMPWDYRPWGCGSGSRGSCNSGWIQFEICEDGLADANYFNKVYTEACELTAYLCKMYNLDPHGTVSYQGVKVPVILCHQDSYQLGLGGNHADIYHWFPKHGKSMETVRNDVAAILKADNSTPTVEGDELYRVRLSWADSKSQIGAYSKIGNAIVAANNNTGYKVFNSKGEQVYPTATVSNNSSATGTQAKDFNGLSHAQLIEKIGPLFTKDQEKTGVLASVSMAQFILESGWGTSELAVNANNYFGMKTSLSGNTWAGSTWKGEVYNKETKEHNGTEYITITAPFRKYENLEASIEDHSAYLLGAKNGSALRYAGLKGETDYKKAFQLIKDGGYATSPTYVQNLCNVVETNNLTKFDVKVIVEETKTPVVEEVKSNNGLKIGDVIKIKSGAKYTSGKVIPDWVIKSTLYVRGISGDKITFSTLKTGAITGVTKLENIEGQGFKAYVVKMGPNASSVNIRAGAGVLYLKKGVIKDRKEYTIVDEKNGWGKLKSGEGWVSLKYFVKVREV